MLIEDFYKTIKDYKNGRFVRLSYHVPLDNYTKAAALKAGNHISKSVVKNVRLGCDYDKMAAVIEAKANGRGTREMYEEPIIEDLLYKNKKNDTVYLRVGNVVGNNYATTIWFNNGKPITEDEARIYLRESYFDPRNGKEVQNIKLENVLSIGGAAA